MPNIHLDAQASTPVHPDVFAAMRPFFSEAFGHPSSLHQHGLRARDALEQARAQIAAFLGAESAEDILFTADGTEAANLAIKGTAFAQQRRGKHLVVSATEQPSVLGSVAWLEQQGFTCTRVAVDACGRVAPEAVQAALTDETILIAVHQVNHDLGTIEPVQAIGELAAARGIAFYVDAEASAGWLPVNVRTLGATLLSCSPHKFYGPKGVGILYRHRRARLEPLLHGGEQEGGRRAGLENVPAIVGAGVAAALATRELTKRIAHTARLQQRLWDGLKTKIPYLKLNGPAPGPERLTTNLHLSVEFTEGEGLLLMLDAQGITVASGTSCVSRALKVSPVLAAIGLDPALAQGSLLLSLGADSSEADVDGFLDVFPKVVTKLRGLSPRWDEFQRGQIDSVLQPRQPLTSTPVGAVRR